MSPGSWLCTHWMFVTETSYPHVTASPIELHPRSFKNLQAFPNTFPASHIDVGCLKPQSFTAEFPKDACPPDTRSGQAVAGQPHCPWVALAEPCCLGSALCPAPPSLCRLFPERKRLLKGEKPAHTAPFFLL